MANGSTEGVTGTLTDGTGVSKILGSKLVKDLVLDAALSIPASLAVINVASLEAALVAPVAVAIAAADALIRVGFRAVVRWAQSPSVA